jgi:uncharacterized protein YcbK (DUF882 family)
VPISTLVRILPGYNVRRPLAAAATAALVVSLSAAPLQNLVANGDTRALSFAHIHTGETLTVTFKQRGRYDEAAVKQINWFLRDWRTDEVIAMDPHLFDVLWEIHREVGVNAPITIISSYRSPKTNSMLRARGRGVARYSQHMLGKAIDFYIPGAELADLRAIGLRLQRGGVGFYPTSGSPFVHVDTGSVRHWPRMTRDQLAKVFPDGKTVHLPTDGKPMPGYALALAEIESRGGRPGAIALAANEEDTDDSGSTPRSARTRIPTATVLTSIDSTSAAPPAPAATAVMASLGPTSPQLPQTKPAVVAALAPVATPAVALTPLPRPRPADLDEVTTASVPRGQVRALGYAATPERDLPGFGPIPATHTRLSDLPDRSRPPQAMRSIQEFADAAQAPAALMEVRGMEQVAELHHPDLYSLRSLVEPVRAALRVQFANTTIQAPTTGRFSGPAVVAVQTLAFDRGAGIVMGVVTARN